MKTDFEVADVGDLGYGSEFLLYDDIYIVIDSMDDRFCSFKISDSDVAVLRKSDGVVTTFDKLTEVQSDPLNICVEDQSCELGGD